MKYNNQVILAAHRGDRKNYPENTMPAFESALRFGADMIETDIHMTRDGHLVIMHDRYLQRTAGFNGLTNEMTLKEIRKLSAGKWFSPEFADVSVPTVEEFIDLIKNTDILINWELKDFPSELGDDFAFATADRLIYLIKENSLEERSMINSFSDRVLEHVFLKHGDSFTLHGQGIYNCQKTIDRAKVSQEKLYDWCCMYPNNETVSLLDSKENFEHCVENGILPCVCVPDELETYKKYVDLGCRMFTSNDIYAADRILKELNLR